MKGVAGFDSMNCFVASVATVQYLAAEAGCIGLQLDR